MTAITIAVAMTLISTFAVIITGLVIFGTRRMVKERENLNKSVIRWRAASSVGLDDKHKTIEEVRKAIANARFDAALKDLNEVFEEAGCEPIRVVNDKAGRIQGVAVGTGLAPAGAQGSAEEAVGLHGETRS